jgi:penicillin amidase
VNRWLRRLGIGATGLLLLAGGGGWYLTVRQLPDDQPGLIPGLQGEVTVAVDGRGVPTLRAADLFDAFRVQGFETARERMFQMELMRRSAEGRLSELVGASALPLDRIHRTYGFRQVAEAAVPMLPEGERRALEAYAAGVNAYLASRPGRWGLEFQLLGLKPESWTPAHSLEVLLLMHEDLSTSWKSEVQAEALKDLPEATRKFLMPSIAEGDLPLTPDLPGTVPDTADFFGGAAAKPSSPSDKAAALRGLEAMQAIPTPDPELRAGSNNWVIAGSRTKSGKPILANDPHLNLGAPGIWFQVRFEVAGHTAQGVSLPGLPGLVIGHNDAVAWGLTNLGTDVQDLYREQATSERVESIPVKGKAPEELRVKLGAHGPQILPGLSLTWTALDPSLLRMPTIGFMQARDWASFNAAVDQFTGPAQNIVYADTQGHIGWRASGLIPIRKKGNDGSRILDGSDPANDWQGYVSQADMPRVFDPPQGFLATANNRVVGTSYPHVVATEWAGTSRAGRIADLLSCSGGPVTSPIPDMQLDNEPRFFRTFRAALLTAGLGPELSASHGKVALAEEVFASAESHDFTHLELVRRSFRKQLLQLLLKGSSVQPAKFRWYNEDAWILAAAKATPEAWKAAGLGDKQAFLYACLKEAQASPNWNKPWGEVNEVRMKHPFGLSGGILGWIFNPKPARLSGSSKSIRVVSQDFGQSMRMVVDLADLDATRLVLPLGQSGHLGSKHRLDQYGDWQKGDPEGTRTRLKQGSVATRVFRP